MKVSNTYRILDNMTQNKNKQGKNNSQNGKRKNSSNQNATEQISFNHFNTEEFLGENEEEVIERMLKDYDGIPLNLSDMAVSSERSKDFFLSGLKEKFLSSVKNFLNNIK